MRLAVIDCGTNTFNLIIIELLDGKNYTKIYNTRIAVKLGEDTINKGFIAEIPFNRGIAAISSFKEKCLEHKVERVLAFATSAIRDADNGIDFVKTIKEKFGIEITIIDGNREAELIYYGIKEAVELTDEISLIMDIGGGSNEFILANKNQLFWKQSFNIGAARLLELFNYSDPITNTEILTINNYLTQQLYSLTKAVAKYKPTELIGSSGAFESLIEMIHGEFGGEMLTTNKTGYHVEPEAYTIISKLVKSSTLDQRKKIKGLVPIRFDMIVISCLMIDFILNLYQIKKLRVSTYSLKEGALADYIHKLAN